MLPKVSRGFSFFGSGGTFMFDEKKVDGSAPSPKSSPSLKLLTDRDVYRPGESVLVTIEICNPEPTNEIADREHVGSSTCSLLIGRIAFELKGIEKLDTQWFATQKPFPGSKQRRGEQVFLDCSTPSIISNQIISSGGTKTYIVRTELPNIIPPSYRGATVRYLYYVRTTLSGQWLILENGHSNIDRKDQIQLEARTPLQIWITQKTSGLLNEEGQYNGILPAMTIQTDIYWKEKDGDSEWARANETFDGVEEGYESSRDEISSVSSYNPAKGNLEQAFGSSLSLQSSAARSSNKDLSYPQGERASLSSYVALPQLSVTEVLYDPVGDVPSPPEKPSAIVSPSQQRKLTNPFSLDDDVGTPSVPGSIEPLASEGFIRGRSYNIRLDDQVLLRYTPRNSDSTYYFSDMIGGTLTFFHEEGARRCLEVSITLETSETITQRFVHHSRRNSPTVAKVQSDYHEVVADLVQTSFLFSIPMDGPMSFSTPHVSVQWALRFEFFTTPKKVDWTRYEHPLLIEGRDKGEWVLPITVHAPPLRSQAAHSRTERPSSLGPLWVRG
ncbi:uncharacterized protein LOC122084054 [Macadamia integrifolia]|uniref:uncharacterized protein LOC122084054 n=1 Tax=Macadamia integrifolia TaxID=60698 RepID=UPI001C4FA92F|nr:uncharacterized protein LOC122084054 [Macadamia integrifolia]XP_042508013.1 uncharacterized protein LOC122084054 [Macadamia integrifolia]